MLLRSKLTLFCWEPKQRYPRLFFLFLLFSMCTQDVVKLLTSINEQQASKTIKQQTAPRVRSLVQYFVSYVHWRDTRAHATAAYYTTHSCVTMLPLVCGAYKMIGNSLRQKVEIPTKNLGNCQEENTPPIILCSPQHLHCAVDLYLYLRTILLVIKYLFADAECLWEACRACLTSQLNRHRIEANKNNPKEPQYHLSI